MTTALLIIDVQRALCEGEYAAFQADGHSTLDNGVLTAAQSIAHHKTTLANMTSFGPRVSLVPASEVQL